MSVVLYSIVEQKVKSMSNLKMVTEVAKQQAKREFKRKMFEDFGCENWTYNKEITNTIRAFEYWTYRRILTISWTDRITNEKVLQLMRTEEILLKRLKERKVRFAGHVMRGSSGDLLNLILEVEGSIEGVRNRGRQRRTRGDDVKEWSRTTSIGDAKRTAESRENWRGIVANLRNGEGTAS
ncbi:hypothetical protein GQR58_025468 [Nymphon striatum]|nr:hypothetical protein GQR58_025468 [Nymphon striatum]